MISTTALIHPTSLVSVSSFACSTLRFPQIFTLFPIPYMLYDNSTAIVEGPPHSTLRPRAPTILPLLHVYQYCDLPRLPRYLVYLVTTRSALSTHL